MPTAELSREGLIRQRQTALFTVTDDEAVALKDLGRIPAMGAVVQSDFAGSDIDLDVNDRVASWLATRNPAFRYRCPAEYLESGDDGKLGRLEPVVGSLEDGVFSRTSPARER